MSWQLYLCKFPNQIRKIFHLSAPCSLPISYLIFPCCVRSGLDSFLFFYLWQLIWWSGRGDSYTNQFHYIEAKINWNKKEEVFQVADRQSGNWTWISLPGPGNYIWRIRVAPLHSNSPRFTLRENKFICSCRSFFKSRPTACNSIKMSSGVNFIENV